MPLHIGKSGANESATDAAADVEANDHCSGQHHGPHRIPAFFPLILIVFWGVLLVAIMKLYNCLRANHEEAYEEFRKKKAEDEAAVDAEDADDEILGDIDHGEVGEDDKAMIKEVRAIPTAMRVKIHHG
eukprot:SAG11_NODE_6470_length_1306_cov_1.505385_2_plen_129_part_00